MSRKKVTQDFFSSCPEPTENQIFARVVGPRGKNLHEVELTDGQVVLVSLPSRYRNLVYVKRGHYVIVEPIKNNDTKIFADIVYVLFPNHVKDLQTKGLFPAEFSCEKEDSSSDDDDLLFHNPNHTVATDSSDDSEGESDEED
ncbi:nucleic acid-binding protein [Basidiobolus meristosporus CBS 931.73]|uniref:Nucleic acid-binding protein n=1 Tax=Basidiobolus meristosporus CBS 931.73 TaxID=1314790 RepID=A0A1Y1YBQ5_9FUNG|nr:nucleic acid-binding protein [Basidiobolus meristosporus CBS 931.73]|eukprot:ORX95429.1 nucleic acid-binding protein [Basidiobolus meristosporus CBS 931.73]